MSVQAMTLVYKIKGGVTSAEKFLLVTLANYADPKMVCWPSQSTLADDTLLTDRTIRTLLAGLEAKGLIKRKARFTGGRLTSALIMLTLSPETISALEQSVSAQPGNSLPLSPETISGEPTSEPLIEPLARDAPPHHEGAARPLGEREEISSAMKDLASQLGARLNARQGTQVAHHRPGKPLRGRSGGN